MASHAARLGPHADRRERCRGKLKGWAEEKCASAAFRGYELRNGRTLDLLLESWGHSRKK